MSDEILHPELERFTDWESGTPDFFFKCEHGVFRKDSEGSLCYTTSKERADWISQQLNRTASLQARLDACVKALEEIRDEGVGALNNAFPDDAPEVVESMAQKAELALKAQRNKQ